MALQKGTDVITGKVFERKLAHRVVAAGQERNFVFPVEPAGAIDHLTRKVQRESGVVARTNELRNFGLGAELLQIAGRADAEPEFAQGFQIDGIFQTGADVAAGQAFPHDIGDECRAVIEDVHAQAGIVRAGEEGITGTEAGAGNAQTFESLTFEPIDTTASVDDRLTRGIDGAAKVGGDGVICARETGGHARIVIRQAETQCADAQALQAGAERIVLGQLRIPVRQNNYRFALSVGRRKPKRADQIVFSERSLDRRGEFKPVVRKFKLLWLFVAKKLFAGLDGVLVQARQILDRVESIERKVARARPIFAPFKSEFERTNGAIGGTTAKLALPAIHPIAVPSRNWTQQEFHPFITNRRELLARDRWIHEIPV